MTPEAQDCLDKAREDLSDARKIQAIDLPKPAARAAYYAAFHAAEALIVARTGRVAKTHSGVRSELARLLREASPDDRDWVAFVARAYKYKELGDYGVGRGVTIADAEVVELIAGAARFIERVSEMLAAPPT